MSLIEDMTELARRARLASRRLASVSADDKNNCLLAMADSIEANAQFIRDENMKDMDVGAEMGLAKPMLDRLLLDEARIGGMATGLREVAGLPDPVGRVIEERTRPNGLKLTKIATPIGVIVIIYESRPNVTADAGALCLKAGNATILRGGSEAINSNRAIAAALQSGGECAGLPVNSIQLIPFTDRESVRHLAEMDQYLDLIIPRGGAGLIETVVSLARMPVIKHYDGICHVYVDSEADLGMATAITVDAKTQNPVSAMPSRPC